MADPNEQGYLIDWYSILRVAPTATQDEIKEAYRAQARDYHPDRYAHLAKDLAAQASERFRLATEAHAVLSDVARREAFDARRASWTGPVSTSGMKVIDLTSRHFDPRRLFDPDDADGRYAMIDKVAVQLAPHDENTLTVLTGMAERFPDDKNIAAAHRDLLRRKDVHLAVRESLLWETAGERNRPTEDAPREHLEATNEAIERLSATAKVACSAYALRLPGNDATPLLPTDATNAADDDHAADAEHRSTEIAIASLHDDAMKRFERIAERIRTLAEERQEVITRRFAAIATTYAEGSPTDGLRLLLRFTIREHAHWAAFIIQDTTITQVSNPVVGGLDEEPSPETITEAIANGCSILHADFEEGLKIIDQLREVVLRHFAQHIPDEDPSDPPEKN